jgi:acetyltransferase-like isoleucine patch superfamily enzyme
LRHSFYKALAGRLEGIGYLGRPSFVKGFRRLHACAGLGIFPGWRIEIIGGRVEMGRNVRIGNNLLLNCGSMVTIGDDVTISGNVFIGTTDFEISADLRESFRDWKTVERPVHIGQGSFIGFGAVLLPGTVLGAGCVVGANAVVRGEYPSGSVIAGNPARTLRTRS